MTDREMLELAAKAAGLDVWWSEPFGYLLLRTEGNRAWMPLTRGGDALWLAIKLSINLEFVRGLLVIAGSERMSEDIRDHGGDMNAATRRAIVRAAAEIGRRMP